jgi:type IV secretion system protein TrbE
MAMNRFNQKKYPALADLLVYAHFIEEGIIINKDGGFLQTFKFRGPDVHSASTQKINALIHHFNQLLLFLDDGWMIHVDSIRIPSLEYPTIRNFPHSIALLIDEERRQHYATVGEHYENCQYLTFVWQFPQPLVKSAQRWFEDRHEKTSPDLSLSSLLNQFKEMIARCLGIIRSELELTPLNNAEILSYLNTCLSGELVPVSPPPNGCYLDVVLGRRVFTTENTPRINGKFIDAITITGYLNSETTAGLLDEMCVYPLIYRWSNRFIPLSETTAERELKRWQKNWNNKVKGFNSLIKEAISGKTSHKINHDAAQMSQEISQALTMNNNHSVRFGYWTSVIILIHSELEPLNKAKKSLSEYLERSGFSCHTEDINAADAWLGAIPGHGKCNARRLFLHSLNLAHVLPLQSIWAGPLQTDPHSLLPPQSPPVFYASTTGRTPFRFHLDPEGIGHQMVLGPTGSGKSTYLDFLIVQFLRYRDAQIFIFDKDFSHLALTHALDGYHYNPGDSASIGFCPLADLDTENAKIRAIQFVENLVVLQSGALSPSMRAAIYAGVDILANSAQPQHRNLTVLRSQIQDKVVRDALQYYTIDEPAKLLDHTADSLNTGYLQTFEMSWLLTQKPDIYLPALLYIFDQIDARLTGLRPALIILEEAWLYISQPLFAAKLKDWLKTLRKKNARVIFATQSLSDLYDPVQKTLTSATAVMMESCPTKIFLPNPHAEVEIKSLYEKIGLNSRQIEQITTIAIPKQHYYVVTPHGNRMIDLNLTAGQSLALAFVGLTQAEGSLLIEYKKKYAEKWVYHWLKFRGLPDWADHWHEKLFQSGEYRCVV